METPNQGMSDSGVCLALLKNIYIYYFRWCMLIASRISLIRVTPILLDYPNKLGYQSVVDADFDTVSSQATHKTTHHRCSQSAAGDQDSRSSGCARQRPANGPMLTTAETRTRVHAGHALSQRPICSRSRCTRRALR